MTDSYYEISNSSHAALEKKSMRNGFSYVTDLLLLIRYPEGKSEHRDGRIEAAGQFS